MADNKSGKQTIVFRNCPEVLSSFSTVGTKEGEGPMREWFDEVLSDDKVGQKTWEEAETKMLKDTIVGAVGRGQIDKHKIDVIFSGDLINQLMSSSYAVRELGIPFLGLYGACSTMAESMLMAGAFVNAGYSEFAAAAASSHFCTAERQFRMPLAHGNQKPPSAQLTVTGSGCFIFRENKNCKMCNNDGNEISRKENEKYNNKKNENGKKCNEHEGVVITGGTIGKIVDMGITDSNMMGAAMAPAAIDTITAHFEDTGRTPLYYDKIFTGDLGKIGKNIVLDTFLKRGIDISGIYEDCGCLIYGENQDAHSGGSGCGCSASIYTGYVYRMMKERKWNNVLLISTGALLSTISTQQGESIPGIAHAVSLSTERGGGEN